jgi:hypothetical protein
MGGVVFRVLEITSKYCLSFHANASSSPIFEKYCQRPNALEASFKLVPIVQNGAVLWVNGHRTVCGLFHCYLASWGLCTEIRAEGVGEPPPYYLPLHYSGVSQSYSVACLFVAALLPAAGGCVKCWPRLPSILRSQKFHMFHAAFKSPCMHLERRLGFLRTCALCQDCCMVPFPHRPIHPLLEPLPPPPSACAAPSSPPLPVLPLPPHPPLVLPHPHPLAPAVCNCWALTEPRVLLYVR